MNKKITVKNSEGQIRYCILLGNKDLEEQFNIWYFGEPHPSHGMKVEFNGEKLLIVDYYTNETRATFYVMSIEDTQSEPVVQWINPETGETGWN